MKVLKRSIIREYEKRGLSEKYFQLKYSFDQKMESEVAKYTNKILDDVKNGNRNCTYKALRKLGVRPGDVTTFYLNTCQTWTDLVMMPHVRIPRRERVSQTSPS